MADGKLTLYYGDTTSYEAIGAGNYDSDGLYFIDGVIYKGENPYGGKVEQVNTLPDTGKQGILYLLSDKSLFFWNGSAWQTISVGMIGVISDDNTNDGKLVSQAAVKTYVDEKFANISTDEATEKMVEEKVEIAINEYREEIDAKIASVFRFKGTKDTLEEVQSLIDATVGDVWHVTADSKEYVYADVTGDGSGEWETLGFTIDLAAYATNEEVSAAIEAAVADVYAKTEVYTKAETDAEIKKVSDNLNEHTGDSDIHVTALEKMNWNNHINNSDIHVTADQKAQWNKASDAITWKTLEV